MNERSSPAPERHGTNLLASIETWLVRNGTFLALLILLAGLVLRLYWAWGCYFNPDEAWHLDIARGSSVKDVYLEARPLTHPPLLPILLHFLLPFGTSELFTRLPSLAAATLGSWFGYRWADRVFGKGIALGFLSLMMFLPGLMLPAVEVRQYGLLVLGVCGVLCFLERGLEEKSGKWLFFGFLWLYIAILSHYSALWTTAALGCYSLVRLYQLKARPGLWITWFCCQSGAGLLYLGLYITQISTKSRLEATGFKGYTLDSYLSKGYFYGEESSFIKFVLSGGYNIFSYLVGGYLAGTIAFLIFAAGLITLLVKTARPGGEKRRELILVLVLPLLFGFIGTLLYLQPFLGSRHITCFMPFIIAGISVGLFRWIRYPVLLVLVLSLIGPFWMVESLEGRKYMSNNNPSQIPRQDMVEALRFLEEEVPPNEALLVDVFTYRTLDIYLGERKPLRRPISSGRVFDRENLLSLVQEEARNLAAGDSNQRWIMAMTQLSGPLTDVVPDPMRIRSQRFGLIYLVQVRIPPDLPVIEETSGALGFQG